MGLDFIREKALQFVQKRDATCSDLSDGKDLLSAGKVDQPVQLYRVKLTDASAKIVPGLRLLISIDSEDSASVIQNGKVVGAILTDDATLLIRDYQVSGRKGGFLTAMGVDTPNVAGIFQIRIHS